MSIVHVPRPSAGAIRHLPSVGPGDLFDALLVEARTENTRLSRLYDMRVFAKFLRIKSPADACAAFVTQGRGNANAMAIAYRSWLMKRGKKAPKSINRRLATLRKIVVLARRLDIVDWVCDVPGLPCEVFRDCRGPSQPVWQKLWDAAVAAGSTPIAARNRLMIIMMSDQGFRAAEVVGLDYPDDVDLGNKRVAIKGKGKMVKSWITIGPRVLAHLREWLSYRGQTPGPLIHSKPSFLDDEERKALKARVAELRERGISMQAIAVRLNKEGCPTIQGKPWTGSNLFHQACPGPLKMNRLPMRQVTRTFAALSAVAGIDREVRAHSLRHYAITRALDKTNGDVRAVQKFARHGKPETTLLYDDSRRDFAGQIAGILGAED